MDFVNGLFELFAGILSWANIKALYRDKEVKGVNLYVSLFFLAWSYWNCFYYPSLGQWLSFVGGLAILVANTIWFVLAMYYQRRVNGRCKKTV